MLGCLLSFMVHLHKKEALMEDVQMATGKQFYRNYVQKVLYSVKYSM